MQYKDILGKVAVITGAGKGIGACFAEGLARQGSHVIGLDIDDQALLPTSKMIKTQEEIYSSTGGSIEIIKCDASSQSELFSASSTIVERHNRIDIWINNVGIFPLTDLNTLSPVELERSIAINLNSVFYGSQVAMKYMKPGGVIINMASVAAFRVRKGRSVYSTTKAAVDALTRSLAVEFGEFGIRVNALAPGFIDTEMTSWVKETPGALEKALSTVPLGRIGQPEEVLAALLFLVSDSASYVTGQTLGVDGGSRYG